LNIQAPVLEPTAKRAGFSMNHEKLNGFYKTKAWEKCRKVYIQSTNGLCERCLGLGIYNAGKIVHHKIPLTESNYQDAAISLNPDNLMLLCHACHEEIHKGKDRFVWTGDGKLVDIPPYPQK
jgi:hypothetical protein